MHLVSRFKLIQENDTAAPVDRQALRAGNYVVVTEISGFFKGCSYKCVLCPLPQLSEIWGTCCSRQPLFGKTCATTQKNVKSHVFLDFEKKRKKT